jgi:hypothetical protein
MADFYTNYPAAQKPMTLGEMLNMASGVQSYQQSQQLNPLALQKAQQEVEQARQINPLALRQKQAETTLAEETLQPKIQQQQTLTKQGQLNLNKDEIGFDSQLFGAIARNPKVLAAEQDPTNAEKKKAADLVIDHHFDTLSALGRPPEKIQVLKEHFKNADPSQYSNDFLTLRQMGMTALNQQNQVLGQEKVAGKDIYGNPLVEAQNPATGQVYQKPLPFAGSPQNMRFAPGESATTLETMQAERDVAKTQAGAVSPALQNISAVRQALKMAQTGRGSEAVSNLQSVFGNLVGSTAEEKAAAARDIIEKNIADLALQKNAALGGKFVAELQGAQNSLASAGRNPTAIAKALDQLEPLLQHSALYQQGLEKAIAKNGGDVQIKRKYDNEMVKTFDVQALMAYNLYKTDRKAFNNLISTLSKDKKDEMSAKIERYAKLSNGDL